MQCPQCGTDGTGEICAACGAAITEETPKWYAEGIAYLTEDKQFDMAEQLLDEGLGRYPESAMLWYNGGVLAELIGKRDKAVKCYTEAYKLKPQTGKYQTALQRLGVLPAAKPAPAPAPAPAPVAAPAPQAAAPVAPPAEAFPWNPEEDSIELPETVELPVDLPPASAAPTASAPPIAVERNGRLDVDMEGEATNPEFVPAAARRAMDRGKWRLVSMVTGIASAASFLLLIIFLMLGKSTLFVADLALFSVAVIAYFISTGMSGGNNQRRERPRLSGMPPKTGE